MTTRPQQLWLLFLFSFILFISPTLTKDAKPEKSLTPLDASHPEVNVEDLHDQSSPAPPLLPGADDVQAAQAILKKLQTSSKRSSRYIRPNGYFSTLVYYPKWLFTILFLNTPTTSSTSSSFSRKPSIPFSNALEHLNNAASLSNPDSLYILADINFYGRYNYPRNFTAAFNNYQALASLNGNSTAQHHVAFMYATGIGSVVSKDQAKAFLYHTFAADGGDTRSQMTVGYRYHSGIGTMRNCEMSVDFYKEVTDKAIGYVRSGPPGGHSLVKEAYYFADDVGGVYGEGASVSSSGLNAKHPNPASDAHAAFDDVLEYLDLMSRKGETKATFGLGRLHYDGSRTMRQDYRLAKDFFLDVARRYWTKDGRIKPDTEPGVDLLASKAAGYLGRMFLRGEGMDQDFSKARIWFKRGIENGDALCQYSLGIMHLNGLGMPKDAVKAAEYFSAAADQDFNSAQVRMGALLMDQGDLQAATRYFELAARNGHIEALYYLGEMYDQGAGRERSCQQAAFHYKLVAEKAEYLHSSFIEANEAYDAGDTDTALLLNMMAAEQGYEVAQANVAYLLEQTFTRSPLRNLLPSFLSTKPHPTSSTKLPSLTLTSSDSATLALIYWTRSAKQANIDSLLKMGDYYLSGVASTPSPPALPHSPPSPEADKAATCYTAASESHSSAQALFNLGWMHEHGIGLARDYHLAKRYYDDSLLTNTEAYLPVTLALFRLRLRSWWNGISGGRVRGISDSDSDTSHQQTPERENYGWTDWLADFLAADQALYERELAEAAAEADAAAAGQHPDMALADIDRLAGEDTGRILPQQHHQHRQDEYIPGAEWLGSPPRSPRRRNGGEDEDESDEWDELDDGLLETLIIVLLAGALAFLVWWRQVRGLRERMDAQRRAAGAQGAQGAVGQQGQGAAQGDAAQRGVFPQPGDPDYAGWIAGGVGH